MMQTIKLLEEISQTWDVNTTSWINYGRSIFSYDANGYLTETDYSGMGFKYITWNSTGKQIYTVIASGVIIEDT